MTKQTAPQSRDESAHRTPSAVEHNGERTHQFISFKVGTEEYAIDILSVREIKGWTSTTVLPNQPDFVLGVMNLRGAIVPVFDLRCRFGRGMTQTTPSHVVIIVTALNRVIGLLVDAVSDILTVNAEEIRPVPETERERASAEFLAGIIAVNEGMVVLLSLETLFGSTVIAKAAALAA
jgi:purine-binding chemotaxis protein CheW